MDDMDFSWCFGILPSHAPSNVPVNTKITSPQKSNIRDTDEHASVVRSLFDRFTLDFLGESCQSLKRPVVESSSSNAIYSSSPVKQPAQPTTTDAITRAYMANRCSLPTCPNHYSHPGPESFVTFHEFPDDHQLFYEWEQFYKDAQPKSPSRRSARKSVSAKDDLLTKIERNTGKRLLCSNHFVAARDFVCQKQEPGKNLSWEEVKLYLKHDAIPSILTSDNKPSRQTHEANFLQRNCNSNWERDSPMEVVENPSPKDAEDNLADGTEFHHGERTLTCETLPDIPAGESQVEDDNSINNHHGHGSVNDVQDHSCISENPIWSVMTAPSQEADMEDEKIPKHLLPSVPDVGPGCTGDACTALNTVNIHEGVVSPGLHVDIPDPAEEDSVQSDGHRYDMTHQDEYPPEGKGDTQNSPNASTCINTEADISDQKVEEIRTCAFMGRRLHLSEFVGFLLFCTDVTIKSKTKDWIHYCDSDGNRVEQQSRIFKITQGQNITNLWSRIKRNNGAKKFSDFTRGMRKSKDFERQKNSGTYGKNARKRVYVFAEKAFQKILDSYKRQDFFPKSV